MYTRIFRKMVTLGFRMYFSSHIKMVTYKYRKVPPRAALV